MRWGGETARIDCYWLAIHTFFAVDLADRLCLDAACSLVLLLQDSMLCHEHQCNKT